MNIAMIGLGVMGQNLALNMESKGYSVAAYDFDKEKNIAYRKKTQGKNISVYDNLKDLTDNLDTPKKIMLMVPAGAPVDNVIENILPYLSEKDIIIDGGNSYFKDTQRRCGYLKAKGINFIGTGVSGGEEGALNGPAMMPGGDLTSFEYVKNIFQDICAKYEGESCCDYMGADGAGHFVKMVHNGIEYSDMQLISEAYFIMKNLLNLSYIEMSEIFHNWNMGELNSYLIEITADILGMEDKKTGMPVVEIIKDTAGQKGTGKWTSTTALDLGVAAPTIAEAVFARCMSAIKEERILANKFYDVKKYKISGLEKDVFIKKLEHALYFAKICSYAQGFTLLKEASKEYDWNLDFAKIARVWRSGCIIRAGFLNSISEVFTEDNNLSNLLMAPVFKDKITSYEEDLRSVCVETVKSGIPAPAFVSALSYFDSYTSSVLPANLLQAQRDYFGAHGFKRLDAEGTFHLK